MTAEERERSIAAYVALGSNINNREQYLQDAITALNQEPGIVVTGLSSIYETEPVGYVDQSAFLNMVVQIQTVIPAEELLFKLLAIENRLGESATCAGVREQSIWIYFCTATSSLRPRLDHSASADA